jgi:glycosyltransferase involved in cell wall biosynthesis
VNKQIKILEKSVGKNIKAAAPQVSIIIPAYNVADFIAEALDSVFAQTFRDFEIIVVNDGSLDTETLEKVLENYSDEIIYIRQENGGASVARNTAISEARGSFLAFLDGDDVWFPEKLASQVKFVGNNGFEMIYCDALLFGSSLYDSRTYMENSPSNGEVNPESLLSGACNVITSGTIVKKDLLNKYGLFDEKALLVEDFELWFRLSKNRVRIGYQKDVMLKYRIRIGSLTGDNIEKAKRSLRALEFVKNKNHLTEIEHKIWEEKYKASQAEFFLENGKHLLAKGQFTEAQKNFAQANNYKLRYKLKVLNFFLTISPKLTLSLFKKLRPAEFSYIAPNNSQK